jgi:hypothetical protein
MRLCAALSVVLVASLVLAFEVMRRPKHHAPPSANVSEGVEGPPAPFRPTLRAPRPAPSHPPPEERVRPGPPQEQDRSATIAGRLRLPDAAGRIYVVVTPSDGTDASATGFEDDEDAFRVLRLVSGRAYDIQLSGSGVRTRRLIGVVAPATDLDVTLEARPIIHVAVGFPRGAPCPIEALAVRTNRDGDDPEVIEADSDDCRFELTGPNEAGPVTVEAAGGGEAYTATVDVPAQGAPAPICLNPPCRANPLEGQAQLRVVLDGVDARSSINATIVPIADADARYGCGSSRFTCSIDALPAGVTYAITASGRDCQGGPITVTTVEGENQVSVPCRRALPPIESASEPVDDPDPDS